MMSPAAEIAAYLATRIAGLTLGDNVFVGAEPDSPADVVTVYDTGGFAPRQTVDGSNFIRRQTIQVRVRNASFAIGYALAEEIGRELENVVHQNVGTRWYLGVFETSGVAHLGRISTGAGIAHVWTSNFQAYVED